MSYLTNHIIQFEEMVEEEEARLKEQDTEIDPLLLKLNLDKKEDDLEDAIDSAFSVMKNLMDTFKAFCDACEGAWKIQEIPAPLRQRLITLDQHNQDKYQKLYSMVQKYADQMRQAHIRGPGNEIE